MHLPCCRERIEGPLYCACAGAQRKRQRRARPRLAVGEERDYLRMLVFDRWCEHDNFAGLTRRQREPSGRRANARERSNLGPKPPDFHPQSCAMRFVCVLCPECPLYELVSRQISGPSLSERTCKREQHWTPCERNHRVLVAGNMTARVHDECPGL